MVNVDTKLLVIFVELLSKRNATYVAEKMHMTAPAYRTRWAACGKSSTIPSSSACRTA